MRAIFLLLLLSGCAAIGRPPAEDASSPASHRSDEHGGSKAKPHSADDSVSGITINPDPQTVTVSPGQTKPK